MIHQSKAILRAITGPESTIQALLGWHRELDHLLKLGDKDQLLSFVRVPPVFGAAAMSDYLEQQIINHIFRNTAIFTPPANVYVALYTTATADDGTGTEVTGGAYARVAVSTTGGWNAPAAAGLTDNIADITFPVATASWGTVTHASLMSASSAGNMWFHGALTASKAVGSGDTIKFVAGDLDVTLA